MFPFVVPVEEVPVDSHLIKEKPAAVTVSNARSSSEERDRRAREHHRSHKDHARDRYR